MNAITILTMVFLPGTFISVRALLHARNSMIVGLLLTETDCIRKRHLTTVGAACSLRSLQTVLLRLDPTDGFDLFTMVLAAANTVIVDINRDKYSRKAPWTWTKESGQ